MQDWSLFLAWLWVVSQWRKTFTIAWCVHLAAVRPAFISTTKNTQDFLVAFAMENRLFLLILQILISARNAEEISRVIVSWRLHLLNLQQAMIIFSQSCKIVLVLITLKWNSPWRYLRRIWPVRSQPIPRYAYFVRMDLYSRTEYVQNHLNKWQTVYPMTLQSSKTARLVLKAIGSW